VPLVWGEREAVSGDNARRLRALDAWIERSDQQGVLEWIAYDAASLDEARQAAQRVLADDGEAE
jgi:predicted xylose isomerase-like sugar epimerase